MANFIQNLLKFKRVNLEKLLTFGFCKTGTEYSYSATLPNSEFIMTVTVQSDGQLSAEVTDPSFNEPYTLHLVEDAEGEFVGQVRGDYEQILTEITSKCYETEIFKSDYLKSIIRHVQETYGDELEFLWKDTPDCAVWRRKDNRKWYGALLSAPSKYFGSFPEERIMVIDLRMKPEELDRLADDKQYFRGYHMNKKHWFSMVMDGSVDLNEVFYRIKNSYDLAKLK